MVWSPETIKCSLLIISSIGSVQLHMALFVEYCNFKCSNVVLCIFHGLTWILKFYPIDYGNKYKRPIDADHAASCEGLRTVLPTGDGNRSTIEMLRIKEFSGAQYGTSLFLYALYYVSQF